jgi:hypothetical protein
MYRRTLLLSAFVLSLAAVIAAAPADKKEPAAFEAADVKVSVTGPTVHDNMAVFLILSKDHDKRDFLTLDVGIDQKLVSVTEQDREQVGTLLIENKSDKPLFLQEGDRIQGGKQDRIIVTSLVVPAKSGKLPLPTFCCEAGRWQLGADGKSFANVSNRVLAPQSIRAAAKGSPSGGGQGAVWERVAGEKKAAMAKYGSPNTNTTLNETLDSAQIKKLCEECDKVMKDLLAKHPDALGVAIAINGKVEEIDIYPNAALLAKQFPRLVKSYAIQAGIEKDKLKGKSAPEVKVEDVEKFMEAGKEQSRRFEGINADNRIRFRETDGALECVTAYKGEAVHRQWLNRAAVPTAPKK